MGSGRPASPPLHPLVAGAVVFGVSGAVLVLEILAARLLAPYVGLTLETYTAIIGVVLAGISAGTWAGGRLADAREPRGVLGPLMILGGLLSLATLPVVHGLGDAAEGRAWYALLAVTLPSFFLPAAVLSAVNPLVVKLQLRRLEETGQTVGRLSALGTAGAIAGTFVTGFVLLPSFATSHVVVVLGLLLAGAGCVLTAVQRGRRGLIASALVAAALAVAALAGDDRCDVETAYFCANVEAQSEGSPRRSLQLDNLIHAFVDVDDPTFLGLPYARRMADVVAVVRPARRPINALSIGGGGFALPRYIAATRPGSDNLVLELDEGVVRLARRRLGLRTGPRMRVRTGDARVALPDLDEDAFDLVIGDAFAALAVPWHLATREAIEDVRRTLRPRGLYALNLIDHPPLNFLRAELRTLAEVIPNVALIAQPSLRAGVEGTSNYILVASDAPIPLRALRARAAPDAVVAGRALRRFVGDAEALTDDHAPADQLLTR